MIIYRVEHSNKCGPYRTHKFELGNIIPGIYIKHKYPTHPGPYDDGLERKEIHKFGFINKKKLLNWFNAEELSIMLNHNYKIFKLIVPNNTVTISTSKKQCMYRRDKVIYKIDITKQFKKLN